MRKNLGPLNPDQRNIRSAYATNFPNFSKNYVFSVQFFGKDLSRAFRGRRILQIFARRFSGNYFYNSLLSEGRLLCGKTLFDPNILEDALQPSVLDSRQVRTEIEFTQRVRHGVWEYVTIAVFRIAGLPVIHDILVIYPDHALCCGCGL